MNEALISFFATALALVAVLLLAYLILKGLGKLSHRHHNSGMTKVLEVTPLGGRDRLVAVEHQNKEMLIGVSSGGMQLLHISDKKESSS